MLVVAASKPTIALQPGNAAARQVGHVTGQVAMQYPVRACLGGWYVVKLQLIN